MKEKQKLWLAITFIHLHVARIFDKNGTMKSIGNCIRALPKSEKSDIKKVFIASKNGGYNSVG